ncbi:MAG: Flp pilus assembly protein CpaB [Clostridiales bacterium]|nr:Flp pilus assembly protein CpaB [Clostridiales bacterium]
MAWKEGSKLVRWKQGVAGFIIKGLIICVSFLGVFAVTYRLNQEYIRQMVEMVTVATARSDMYPGETLTPDKLVMAEKPVFGLGGDYVQELDEFFRQGPWYVGDVGLGAGDVLRPHRLASAAEAGGDWRWEFDRREHVRLIAVETSLVRSGGDWLWPGMLVDAMVYIPARESYDDPQPSRVVGPDEDPALRGLLVIDKKNTNGMSLGGQALEDGFGRDLLPAVVTLMLDEGDMERIKALIRYNEEGRIYFSPTNR